MYQSFGSWESTQYRNWTSDTILCWWRVFICRRKYNSIGLFVGNLSQVLSLFFPGSVSLLIATPQTHKIQIDRHSKQSLWSIKFILSTISQHTMERNAFVQSISKRHISRFRSPWSFFIRNKYVLQVQLGWISSLGSLCATESRAWLWPHCQRSGYLLWSVLNLWCLSLIAPLVPFHNPAYALLCCSYYC